MSKKTEQDAEKIHDTFTEEQLSEIREAFNLFPQERECIRADSVETLLRALGHNPSPEEMQRIFKHLHIYSQSRVSFNVFLSVMAMLFSACSEESIRQAFRMFDKVSPPPIFLPAIFLPPTGRFLPPSGQFLPPL